MGMEFFCWGKFSDREVRADTFYCHYHGNGVLCWGKFSDRSHNRRLSTGISMGMEFYVGVFM